MYCLTIVVAHSDGPFEYSTQYMVNDISIIPQWVIDDIENGAREFFGQECFAYFKEEEWLEEEL